MSEGFVSLAEKSELVARKQIQKYAYIQSRKDPKDMAPSTFACDKGREKVLWVFNERGLAKKKKNTTIKLEQKSTAFQRLREGGKEGGKKQRD